MDISVCIKDLLYRYDCVIVPNFGGFVANLINSQIVDGMIYPPRKIIAFNVFLQHNDGLLVNHVARRQKWDYQKALENIKTQVEVWKQQLKTKPLFLEDIGEFYLNKEQNIVFKPDEKINYYTGSFGLTPCKATKIVNVLQPSQKSVTYSINFKQTLKYVAGFALIFFVSSEVYQSHTISLSTETNDSSIAKVQSAGFVEEKTKEPPPNPSSFFKKSTKRYYVVLGVFQKSKNAFRKRRNVVKKGLKARILKRDKKGWSIVAMGKYHSEAKARQMLRKVRRQLQKDAWILVK